jgi:photosystem II stability/assembly factor-like uncharacterized protein
MKPILIIFFLSFQSLAIAQNLDTLLKPVKYRNIGPFRGGRSVCGTGVVSDPLAYYMGTTGGGLWKTEDAGVTWKNISDDYFKTGSVGAVAVSESDPNVVYCGMGEHAPRGVMTSYGDGVYKSNDAGKTWRKMGLEKTQQISRIAIHPKNPDIVYVAAQGAINAPTQERGIYKSTDGGATWKRVLFVNDLTGCSELSMDVHNPLVLYAAMWHHQRLPWKVISGGPGSGLYKSSDGGENWEKMHAGLPRELGKMAIAVSRANSDKVYALIESDSEKEQGGMFASENGGKTWSKVSSDHRLVQRAWYYIEVFPDPQDEHTVYVMSAPALRSIDGGKTWEYLSAPHGDCHDLWINPNNNKNLAIADDGGVGVSFNTGASWSSQRNMPTAQFYRVNVDNNFPYRLYAGQQDNTSVRINSMAPGRYAISEQHWTYSAGGESAFLAFDPDQPNEVMGGSYLGTIELLNSKADAGTSVMAAPIQYLGRETKEMKYRFNWNAPIIWSKHEPGTFYHGAQYLLRTRDKGITWEEASADLTRNEKEKQGKGGGPYTNEAVGAENYGTLSYVIESPQEKGVIWTGSDDGVVSLTRDNGKTWTNVFKTLPECLVHAIEVSPHNPGTAYIATTRFKFNDFAPGLYKTTDYGKTWNSINKGIPYGSYTRVVREDVIRKDLLFAGTETGMFISWNGGASWQPFKLNSPVVPVTDLMIKHDDLIVATAGRSFWILDDLGLIRQFNPTDSGLKVYQPEDARLGNWGSPLNSSSTESFKGTHPFEGINPANGVVIYYQLPKLDSASHISIDIRDAAGNVVNSFTSKKDPSFEQYDGGPSANPVLSKVKGLNRFVWDMRYPTLTGATNVYLEGSYRGHKASPGTYSLMLRYGGSEVKTSFKILTNPLYDIQQTTYDEYHTFMLSMETSFSEMHKLVNDIMKARTQLASIVKEMGTNEKYAALKKEGEELIKQMTTWDEDMVQRKSKAYDDVDNFPNKFTANYMFLINQTESDIPRVNKSNRDRFAELNAEWAPLKVRGLKIKDSELPAYTRKLWDAGIGAVYLIGR